MVTACWNIDPFPKSNPNTDTAVVSPQKAVLHLCIPASPCLSLPLTAPTHWHMCLIPWHPGVLARNSTPIPSTPRHSLSPSLFPAWSFLDLTHALVGCQLVPSPTDCQGGLEGTGSQRCQKPQAPEQGWACPSAASQHLQSGLLRVLLSCTQTSRDLRDSEVVAGEPRLHRPLYHVANPSLAPQRSKG